MNFLRLTSDPLSVDEVMRLVGDPSCGATSFFVGTTRDNFDGKIVCRLEYEAYNEMAEKEMNKICIECRSKWKIKNIAIHHRLGEVGIKEASVILAVSSEHRRESLDAVSFIIDALKASVPIWKREIYGDASSEWKKNKECAWAKEMQGNKSGIKIKEEIVDPEEIALMEEPMDNDNGSIFENRNMPVKREFHADERPQVEAESFVQINASKEEMERRIKAFQVRKREELNALNIQEFCMNGTQEIDESSCARTTAIVLQSKGSNSHVKFTKVFNEWGPQTAHNVSETSRASSPLKRDNQGPENREQVTNPVFNPQKKPKVKDKSSAALKSNNRIPEGIQERLLNVEEHLGIHSQKSTNQSIYSRLKSVEDRILFLEGLSPEYFNEKTSHQAKPTKPNKMEEKLSTPDDWTIADVDDKIFALKKQLKERQLGISL